jgi:hypothetical protein
VIGYFEDADARDAAMDVSAETDGGMDGFVALGTKAPPGS